MIDLHTHTIHSDGTISVKEMLTKANELKLKILSITDHNSVDAYYDKEFNNDIFKGQIIKGTEITTTYNGEIVEVLGYKLNTDIMKKLYKEKLIPFDIMQKKEYDLIIKKYNQNNIKFNKENIKYDPTKESCRYSLWEELMKYEENKLLLTSSESATNYKTFVRMEIFNPLSKLFVDLSSLFPSLDEAIEMIHKSGGLAFFAHTFEYSDTIIKSLNNIIKEYKLDGLECFHPSANDENSVLLTEICKKNNLYRSGGSDYHGYRNLEYFGKMLDENIVNNWINK